MCQTTLQKGICGHSATHVEASAVEIRLKIDSCWQQVRADVVAVLPGVFEGDNGGTWRRKEGKNVFVGGVDDKNVVAVVEHTAFIVRRGWLERKGVGIEGEDLFIVVEDGFHLDGLEKFNHRKGQKR